MAEDEDIKVGVRLTNDDVAWRTASTRPVAACRHHRDGGEDRPAGAKAEAGGHVADGSDRSKVNDKRAGDSVWSRSRRLGLLVPPTPTFEIGDDEMEFAWSRRPGLGAEKSGPTRRSWPRWPKRFSATSTLRAGRTCCVSERFSSGTPDDSSSTSIYNEPQQQLKRRRLTAA